MEDNTYDYDELLQGEFSFIALCRHSLILFYCTSALILHSRNNYTFEGTAYI